MPEVYCCSYDGLLDYYPDSGSKKHVSQDCTCQLSANQQQKGQQAGEQLGKIHQSSVLGQGHQGVDAFAVMVIV